MPQDADAQRTARELMKDDASRGARQAKSLMQTTDTPHSARGDKLAFRAFKEAGAQARNAIRDLNQGRDREREQESRDIYESERAGQTGWEAIKDSASQDARRVKNSMREPVKSADDRIWQLSNKFALRVAKNRGREARKALRQSGR